MELASLVRLGAARGILDVNIEKINELIVNMQPATVSAANENAVNAAERDAVRARIVRETLG